MTDRKRLGVVLFQLGGPDGPGSVEPFLFNLFNDPDIIDIPFGWLARRPLARWLARRRSVHAGEGYSDIGGRSPIPGSSTVPRRREPPTRSACPFELFTKPTSNCHPKLSSQTRRESGTLSVTAGS